MPSRKTALLCRFAALQNRQANKEVLHPILSWVASPVQDSDVSDWMDLPCSCSPIVTFSRRCILRFINVLKIEQHPTCNFHPMALQCQEGLR